MKRKIAKIGRFNVSGAVGYVFDGCHKFYVIETESDRADAIREWGADLKIRPLDETFVKLFRGSCPLRFVNNWRLTKQIIPQCAKKATFLFNDGSSAVYRTKG